MHCYIVQSYVVLTFCKYMQHGVVKANTSRRATTKCGKNAAACRGVACAESNK